MIRLAVPIFAISFASSVQAVPLAPIQSPSDITVTVRDGCGVGFQRVGNRCMRNTSVRQVWRYGHYSGYLSGRAYGYRSVSGSQQGTDEHRATYPGGCGVYHYWKDGSCSDARNK